MSHVSPPSAIGLKSMNRASFSGKSSMRFPTTMASPLTVLGEELSMDSPGPMSVLEWRRAVWVELHSSRQKKIGRSTSVDQMECSDPRKRLFKYHDAISASESDEDPIERLNMSKATNHYQRGKQNLSGPLIDLSQPRDADGRPIQGDEKRSRLARKGSGLPLRRGAADEVEQRHREAMRRLQAEATDQLVQAQWEARERRRRQAEESPIPVGPPTRQNSRPPAPLRRFSALARRSVPNFPQWISSHHQVNSPTNTATLTTTTATSYSSRAGILLAENHEVSERRMNHEQDGGDHERARAGKRLMKKIVMKIGKIRRSATTTTVFRIPESDASFK